MKFVLNTAIDPHFCALFDDSDNLVEVTSWERHRKDGQAVYDFMKKHRFSDIELTFIGAVSGPGGFSSLRVSSAALQALALKFGLSPRQIRADDWASNLCGDDNFVLNSFGKTVWVVVRDSKREKIKKYSLDQFDHLARIEASKVAELLSMETINTFFLPPEKSACFHNRIDRNFNNDELAISLLKNLQDQEKVNCFVPAYNFAPV